MDVRDIKYPDKHFDLAVDKSTIDALLCGERSFINVAVMMKEVQRVLKVGGIYMIISYGKPENRVFHLEREHLSFDINIYTIKKDYSIDNNFGLTSANNPNAQKYEKIHYVYICKKKEDADEICNINFDKVIQGLETEEKMEEEFYKVNSNNYYSSKEEEEEDQDIYDDQLDNLDEDYEFEGDSNI